MDYSAKVMRAIPWDDFIVVILFSDGTVRFAEIKPYIEKGGIFTELADEHFFEKNLTVHNGTVAWHRGDEGSSIDLDPCVLYENSQIIFDPLKDTAKDLEERNKKMYAEIEEDRLDAAAADEAYEEYLASGSKSTPFRELFDP